MYIEVLHDKEGEIVACYCSDVSKINPELSFFVMEDKSEDLTQVRINLDTIMSMDIDQNSPKDRTDYIRNNYKVDIKSNINIPKNIKMPQGMKMRKFNKK